MNEFLENLEIGENKVKLSKEEIKLIMAEHGKTVKTETEKVKETYQKDIDSKEETIKDLKKQIENAPKSEEMDKLKETVANYEKENAEREQKEKESQKDAILTQNINEAIGDKKFVNEYTKNSIINEVKTALKEEKNAGKSAKELFDSITKDQMGIFESSNQIKDTPSTGDVGGDAKTIKNDGIKLNSMFKSFN